MCAWFKAFFPVFKSFRETFFEMLNKFKEIERNREKSKENVESQNNL